MRVKFSGTLEDLAAAVVGSLYPSEPTEPTEGWGSIHDDESTLGRSAGLKLHAHASAVQEATDSLPKRLRLRYYYDEIDRSLLRHFGDTRNWKQVYNRHAFDVIIFDGDEDNGFPVLVSLRDIRGFNSRGVSAVRSLFSEIDDQISIQTETIPESLNSNFFQWLLYRLSQDNKLTDDVFLDLIREMSTSDGMLRGARFTEDAAMERLEVASLLAKGNAKFGPAKLCVESVSLDATFEFELFLDGGFSAFRSSHYGLAELRSDELGLVMVEDLWWRLLPAIRAAYNSDMDWIENGSQKIQDLAADAVAMQLSLQR